MRSIRVLTILALTAGLASAADVSIRQRFGRMGFYEVEETEYFTQDKVVMNGEATRIIVDLAAKTVTSVDNNDKFYTVKSFDDLRHEAEASRTKSGAAASSPVTLEPTGKKQKIAGHEAKEYTIKSDALSGTVWLADDLTVPAEAVKWARVAWMSGPKAPDVGFQDALGKHKGVPLLGVVNLPLGSSGGPSGTWTWVIEAKKIGKEAPSPDTLKVPDGYVKRTRERIPVKP